VARAPAAPLAAVQKKRRRLPPLFSVRALYPRAPLCYNQTKQTNDYTA